MSRAGRDFETSDITSISKTTLGSAGRRVAGTPSTVVTGYTFLSFPPSLYARERMISQYGLTANSEVFRVTGPYDQGIENGMLMTVRGKVCRVVSCIPIRGSTSTSDRLALVVVATA